MFQFIQAILGRGVANTSPGELKNRLARGERPTIIDVRSQEEYAGGHIPGARLIPLDRLTQELGSLNPDDEILLVCRGGFRSIKAYRLLAGRGFKRLRSVTGGMMAWDGPVV